MTPRRSSTEPAKHRRPRFERQVPGPCKAAYVRPLSVREIERAFDMLGEQFGVDMGAIPVDVLDKGDAFLVTRTCPATTARTSTSSLSRTAR